jgi:hypothetical protein
MPMRERPDPHDPAGIVVAAMAKACPSFVGPWQEHLAAWAGSPEPPGAYTNLSAFASHLVSLLEADTTGEFPTVFAAVEDLMTRGDDGVRYLLRSACSKTLETSHPTAAIGPSPVVSGRGSDPLRRRRGRSFTGSGARVILALWPGDIATR